MINEFFQQNLSIIMSLAKKYLSLDPTLELQDLLNEAYLAISDAIKHYDKERGASFPSVAFWYIQKRFQQIVGEEREVIVNENGSWTVLLYQDYLKLKAVLPESQTVRKILNGIDRNGDPEKEE